jgi:hypothetical protein
VVGEGSTDAATQRWLRCGSGASSVLHV